MIQLTWNSVLSAGHPMIAVVHRVKLNSYDTTSHGPRVSRARTGAVS